jgi:CheY-like chemotaxis protein
MIKKVLLVDDDYEMLLVLKEGIEKYRDSFSILLASNGRDAVESLKKNVISLVVTDLKMPGMDGFQLLAHIMEHYPDIPVIIITGYSTPEMENLARKGGAVGYIAKPFLIENLARQIMTALRKESEGGTLHNVSSGIFLQLVEMEQKTCTVRLEDKFTGKKGVLFFREGELLDSRTDNLQGKTAAYEIFSWDQVNLSIQNGCALKEKRMHSEMQHLILEAARRKDENKADNSPRPGLKTVPLPETDQRLTVKSIRKKIESGAGTDCGVEDIYQDNSWESLVLQFSRAGELFDLGTLQLGYVDRGEANDYIILPGEDTTVVSLNPKCPRDKLLKILGD